jgi:hypothetical protein
VVVRGHKEGFYLVNSICIDGVTPPSGGNGNFLAAGCGDIYSSGLGCQYVDVTKLKPGKYTLSVELNPLRKIEEASYDNNLQTYDFEICSRKPDSLKFSYGLGREDLGGKRAFTVEAEIRYKSAKSIKFYNPMYQGLQADLTARPRSAMSLTIPAGKVGKGCYPKDGWKLIEKNVWEYRNDSGLDPDCYSGTYSDIRTARVKKANNKLFVTLRGRADVSAFPGVPDSAAFVMTSTGFPTSSGNETCAYQGESGRCKRVGPGKALVLCD